MNESTRYAPLFRRAIVIATRWNDDDLSGRLIKAAQEGDGWPVRRLRLPAIAEADDPLGRVNNGERIEMVFEKLIEDILKCGILSQ